MLDGWCGGCYDLTMPQSSPLQVIRNLSVIPTGYTSQQLGALSAQVRLGAFFSAQVESERYLQGLRAMVAGALMRSWMALAEQ